MPYQIKTWRVEPKSKEEIEDEKITYWKTSKLFFSRSIVNGIVFLLLLFFYCVHELNLNVDRFWIDEFSSISKLNRGKVYGSRERPKRSVAFNRYARIFKYINLKKKPFKFSARKLKWLVFQVDHRQYISIVYQQQQQQKHKIKWKTPTTSLIKFFKIFNHN